MERNLFKSRFLVASARARDFARTLIAEQLPEEMRFNVLLNSSYDGTASPAFTLFPEDSSDEVVARTKHLSADQVVDLLWRDGLVPQWVDIAVASETVDATLLEVKACGRFIADESALYYTWTDCAPFSPKGPALPVPWVEGERFSIYNRSSCWSRDDLARALQHGSRLWSLELHGGVFDDDVVSALVSPTLEILELYATTLRGPGLRCLSRLPKLRVLRLGVSDVDELSVREMPPSDSLEAISIQSGSGIILGLGALSTTAPNLRELSLMGSSDLAAEPIELPSSLQGIELEVPHVPRLALAGSGMRTLGIHARAGDDAEVSTLLSGAHTGIENVSLRGTPVSDAIFGELARFQGLSYLDVVDTKVTTEALHRFTAERPSLRFFPQHRTNSRPGA